MPKNKNKTQASKVSVSKYIASIQDATSQSDAKLLLKIFKEATGISPVMWGNMIGFGSYHYIYDSGREGDYFATGFAMRKSGPTIYIMPGYSDYSKLLDNIGPHKLGKSCLYVKKASDIDMNVLKKLIKAGLRDLKKIYPVTLK